MKQYSRHTDRKDSLAAACVAVGIHLVAVLIALCVLLHSPQKIDQTLFLDLNVQIPARSEPQPNRMLGRKKLDQSVSHRKVAPDSNHPALQRFDLPATETAIATGADTSRNAFESVRDRFLKGKLSEISEEEAFEELKRLLAEYPEYKGLLVEKMLAGKSMPESPDFFVDLGIRDYLEHLDVRTKYEYEAMRQSHLFGTYHDPVNGPNGYKKGGVQVNVIELASWLYGLLGIRK